MTRPSPNAERLAREILKIWVAIESHHPHFDAEVESMARTIDAAVAPMREAAEDMGETKTADPEAAPRWRRLRAALDGWRAPD